MASIYSVRFADGTATGSSNTTVYTVPTGMVAIVRSISLTPISVGMGNAQILRNGGAIIYSIPTGTDLQTYPWEGRAVLNAGEEINVYLASGTLEYAISGYLLDA